MDDLELIEALLPGSQAPAPEAREAARALLLAAFEAERAATPVRPIEAARSRPRARSAPRRVALIAAVIVALALALAGLAVAGDALGILHVGSSSPSSPALTPGAAPYVSGDQLYGLGSGPSTLARPIADQRWGTAVLSPDGSTLVYESATASGGSELRRRDLASGADTALEPGTFAPVWSASGQLAYGRTTAPAGGVVDVGAVYPSRIEVRSSIAAAPVVWSGAPSPVRPVAWAGSSLLVEQVGNNAVTTVWAYSAPGVARSLGTGWVVAVDPAGSDVLIGAGEEDGPPSPTLRVVDVADGSTVATLDLRASTGIGAWQQAAPNGVGTWSGGSIVLPASSSLVTLSLTDGSLGVASVRRLHGASELAGADYRAAAVGTAGASSVILLADVVPPGGGQTLPAAVACDLARGTCTVGGIAPRRQPLSLVSHAGAIG
jgi:hypothetical protein